MINLYDELALVCNSLEKAGIRYALVGGLAYSFWVESRATEDIDFLIAEEDWEKVKKVLDPLNYKARALPMDFATIRIRRLTKLAENDAMVLDFLLADGEFAKGLETRVGIPFRDSVVQVALPETIIALKRPRMSDKDKSDIANLERFMRENRPDKS